MPVGTHSRKADHQRGLHLWPRAGVIVQDAVVSSARFADAIRSKRRGMRCWTDERDRKDKAIRKVFDS